MGMSCGGRGVRCENGEVGRAAVTRIGSCMGYTRGYSRSRLAHLRPYLDVVEERKTRYCRQKKTKARILEVYESLLRPRGTHHALMQFFLLRVLQYSPALYN